LIFEALVNFNDLLRNSCTIASLIVYHTLNMETFDIYFSSCLNYLSWLTLMIFSAILAL